MEYLKICEYCQNKFYSSGPAGRFCKTCMNKRIASNGRVEKGIYRRKDKYWAVVNRQSCGRKSKYCDTLEEAREFRDYWLNNSTVISQHGESNNAIRGGVKRSKMANFHKRKKEISEMLKRGETLLCERCATKLEFGWEWALHHIDHNRLNDSPSNFEVLCKRCHQIEHECWNNFNNQGAS